MQTLLTRHTSTQPFVNAHPCRPLLTRQNLKQLFTNTHPCRCSCADACLVPKPQTQPAYHPGERAPLQAPPDTPKVDAAIQITHPCRPSLHATAFCSSANSTVQQPLDFPLYLSSRNRTLTCTKRRFASNF
eukprot:366489-Chlamydomonas_euryale.AAC.3